MGTANFAVPSLAGILDKGYSVVAVITAPDKPAGRGRRIRFSPVKEFAIKAGLNILQPENLKDPEFINQLKSLKSDLQIVVAFRMLPEAVWKIPGLGTLNLHASLLPQYRGAAPINHAIMNGEEVTGVTTFMIDEKIDTGKILMQEKVKIGTKETAGELHDRLMIKGAALVLKTIETIESGTFQPIDQQQILPGGALKTAPKISREDCRIDWSRDAKQVFDFIRGLSPAPGAFTEFETVDGSLLTMKVFRVDYFYRKKNPATSEVILTDGKKFLYIACRKGYIDLQEIQIEGKKRMSIETFLRGFDTGKIAGIKSI